MSEVLTDVIDLALGLSELVASSLEEGEAEKDSDVRHVSEIESEQVSLKAKILF